MRAASLALAAATIAVGFVLAPVSASASGQHLSKEQIRSMPITARPNRPGHVYGNTVRFFHHMRAR